MKKEVFQKFKKIGDLKLSGFAWHDGSPLCVEILWDENSKTAYQVDWGHEIFRLTKSVKYKAMPYGDWQKFTG